MTREMNQQTEAVLQHHLQAFVAGDVNDILADFTEESVFITPDSTARGPEEMRPLFKTIVTSIVPPGSKIELLKQVIEGEVAYILWSASSANYEIPLGTDTFVIRGGKIMVQTFAGQIISKST